ncbi:metallophosphoesterase [Flexithrix dorotheae]|uniref:metallophosphoesterase n=1 Tax=Flexithrix dorotheae TaxID=70993 RepID=UPI00037B02EB|nr:metallophosphoesterase [Flexithrix dorotheae]
MIQIKNLLLFLFSIQVLLSACSKPAPVLKIGLVADPQYADQPTKGNRFYKESIWKLEEAMDTFNHYDVDFVQTLGDVIDVGWESYDSILPVYEKLNPHIKSYQLLGNHDFSMDSSHLGKLLERLQMPDYYYAYSKNGWRFIVLDATDYAYFSNLLHHYDTNQVNTYFEYTEGKSNNHLWNGAIGKAQQDWLKQQLDSASQLHQKVILYSHLPVRPEGDAHNLWNDFEIAAIIENYPNVVAFINGHNHAGNYIFKNGVHYITLFGMVDTEMSSYGILNIYEDSLVLKGYGNQKDILIKTQ